MAMSLRRRGVVMTSIKKPVTHVALDSDDDSDDHAERKRLESQNEWEELERQAREELRRRNAGQILTRERQEQVVAYDDVAGPGNADSLVPAVSSTDPGQEEAGSSGDEDEEEHSPDAAESALRTEEGAELNRPDSVVTAGSVRAPRVRLEKTRGGKHKTGSMKRRLKAEKAERERGEAKRKAEEEESDRWKMLKLVGDEKPKRIDTTRMVTYHDFDSNGTARSSAGREEEVPIAAPAAPPGNFRALVQQDMWGDDDEDS